MIPSKIISERSREGRALPELVRIEFVKLRRRKYVWLMLPSAFIMPAIAACFFKASGMPDATPMRFYKMAAFSYTIWLVLPAVLGMLCTMLMYEERCDDTLKQLWIVPVSKTALFFSKLTIVIVYSVCFMFTAAAGSFLAGILTGITASGYDSVRFLFLKCLQCGILIPFAMMPVLAVAASQKGYVLPVCITVVYAFTGFIMLMVNVYVFPLSSAIAVLIKDIEGVVMDGPVDTGMAFLSIAIWGTVSAVFGVYALGRECR